MHKGETLAVSMTAGRILNIPNILTLARIALIPVFLAVAYWPPVMGIEDHGAGMSRHILLTGIFVVARSLIGLMAIWLER